MWLLKEKRTVNKHINQHHRGYCTVLISLQWSNRQNNFPHHNNRLIVVFIQRLLMIFVILNRSYTPSRSIGVPRAIHVNAHTGSSENLERPSIIMMAIVPCIVRLKAFVEYPDLLSFFFPSETRGSVLAHISAERMADFSTDILLCHLSWYLLFLCVHIRPLFPLRSPFNDQSACYVCNQHSWPC